MKFHMKHFSFYIPARMGFVKIITN